MLRRATRSGRWFRASEVIVLFACVIVAALMLAAVIWTILLTAACLVYPRRPRTAAILTVLLGVWTIVARVMHWNQARSPIGFWPAIALGTFWCALGFAGLFRFRTEDARRDHVGYWTARE